MKRQLRNLILAFGLFFGLLVLFYPVISSMAQKDQNRLSVDQESSMQVVSQNVVGSSFYDTLQRHESDWMLIKANLIGGQPFVTERGVGQDAHSILLVLKKGNAEVQVMIQEYSSDEDAKMPLKIMISQGRIDECKSEECGDGGRKYYRQSGDFSGLGFRSGSFFVSIYCNSENVAKRFAGYALNAIANK